MFCPKCGKEAGDNNQFCPECGSPIVADTAASSSVEKPSENTATSPQEPSSPSSQAQNSGTKKTVIIVIAVISGLLILSILGAIGYGMYSGYNKGKTNADTATDKSGVNSESTASTTKSGSISTTWAGYEIAKQKVTYKNSGLVAIRSVYDSKAKQGAFTFTFIDKDSKFKKDDYNYYKAEQITVNESGQSSSENQDFLASNDSYAYGTLALTESKLTDVLSKGKSAITAQYPGIGETYAILYVCGESDLSPATWDVYYVKSGQDETAAGYKQFEAYAVRMNDSGSVTVPPSSSTLSFEIK